MGGNFLSYEMGLYEPSADIFKAECFGIGKQPNECYYFDDDKENVLGASDAGLRAYHFRAGNLTAIRKEVERYLP